MSIIAPGVVDTSPNPHNLVQTFTVTCPAGTDETAPVTSTTTLGVAEVTLIEVVIPPGHAGATGIRLLLGGSQVVPRNDGGWLVGDGTTLSYPVTGYLNTGLWKVQMYNTGRYDHSWIVRYVAEYVYPDPPAPAPTLIASPIIV